MTRMARYGRDFMGRGRGMRDRMEDDEPLDALGPGAEGYYLSRDMAMDVEMDYRRGARELEDDGGFLGGMAQFGRAGRGRGYGGDFRTGRGGYDRGEFFVNRRPGESGYRPGGYERDVGMRGAGYAAGQRGRGYRADYDSPGFAMGYDRGFRGGFGR
ncbi:MAG TPA: hypothetical protein VHG08_23590 [Longimicrobium sp.]|nr:hypothetical protein [Longimicrobium sp.]